MRVYSTYDDTESAAIAKAAQERGVSISAYQRLSTLKALGLKNNTRTIPNLILSMKKSILDLPTGSTFVISALLKEDYYSLKKSDQVVLAKSLAKYARENPHILQKNSSIKTTTQYIRM